MRFKKQLAVWVAFACVVLGQRASMAALHSDEAILFYPAIAKPVRDGFELTLNGIVFEPEKRPLMIWMVRQLTGLEKEDLTEAEWEIFKQRCRYFLVDHERGKRFSVQLGREKFGLSTSKADGHFDAQIKWKTNALAIPVHATNGAIALAVSVIDQKRQFPLELHVLEETGLSIISDIDDTIKVSDVLNKTALLRNTFCRPFKSVDGMPALYHHWATNSGAQFHYVTASPWQLYQPLADFVRSNGFPSGTFHMKEFRIKDRSAVDLFTSPERYKPGVIEPLLKQFPKREFILVGDSGERDPEIYGAIARKYPKQIRLVLIRDIADAPTPERYEKAFADLRPAQWKLFKKPEELRTNAPPSTPRPLSRG